MAHVRITITCPDEAIKDILIARLSEAGYEAFEEDGMVLHAFIPESRFDAPALDLLLANTRPLPASPRLAYQQELIPDANWNADWERDFHPVVVGDFVAVRASFHPPVPGVKHELIITPKMSFGTGHHATTWMMIEAMQHLDVRRRSVLDFGTGTGVLAILADRLGATRVLAIDHDDWSIENARENIAINHCTHITLNKMSTIPSNELFSIVLANINKNVILKEMHAIGQQLTEDGVILLSGLLLDDEQDIAQCAARNNLTISYNGRMTKGNWICLKLVRIKN
ncbi:MAG: 50S ribosomal protein L11 methyltransferase [Bacteroidota bacterium]|nr:50S ribosomal protein L11 methyltransferase [Bacteroidota bacterium]